MFFRLGSDDVNPDSRYKGLVAQEFQALLVQLWSASNHGSAVTQSKLKKELGRMNRYSKQPCTTDVSA